PSREADVHVRVREPEHDVVPALGRDLLDLDPLLVEKALLDAEVERQRVVYREHPDGEARRLRPRRGSGGAAGEQGCYEKDRAARDQRTAALPRSGCLHPYSLPSGGAPRRRESTEPAPWCRASCAGRRTRAGSRT